VEHVNTKEGRNLSDSCVILLHVQWPGCPRNKRKWNHSRGGDHIWIRVVALFQWCCLQSYRIQHLIFV